ncbi:hypothetical protein ACF0H5_021457 [Mactra antiquata]
MHMLFGSLHKRMDKLEAGLEQRIANEVSQLLDKWVYTEMNRIHRDMDEKFDSFQESIKLDLADVLIDINYIIQSFSSDRTQMEQKDDIRLNIVIRDLPELSNENIESKVNGLISNGLNLRGVLGLLLRENRWCVCRNVYNGKKHPSKLAGVVLFASYLTKPNRLRDYPVPLLTLSGDLDGLTRITRVVDTFD